MTYVNLELAPIFESVREMDDTVKKFNQHLNKSQYRVLNLLKQYSLKTLGISYLKQPNIAEALKISTRQVSRILQFLKVNGYISVIQEYRPKRGGKGACKYIINRLEVQQEIQKKYKEKEQKKKNQSKRYAVKKSLAEGVSYGIARLDHALNLKDRLEAGISRKKPHDVPDEIYHVSNNYFSDKDISNMYQAMIKKCNKHNVIYSTSENEVMIYAINCLVKAKQRALTGYGEPVKNEIGYLINVLDHYLSTLPVNINKDDFKQKNVVSQMSYRDTTNNSSQTLGTQAFDDTKENKETINSFNLFKNICNTTYSISTITDYLKNIKHNNIRTKPLDVPNDFYNYAKSFYSDETINMLYKKMVRKCVKHNVESNHGNETLNGVIINAFKDLIKAKKNEYQKSYSPVKNDIAYLLNSLDYHISELPIVFKLERNNILCF